MGRVTTEATIENLRDLWDVKRNMLAADQVRRVVISDALADCGATTLALPRKLIELLGLEKQYNKPALSSTGLSQVNVYDTVRLTIQGRYLAVDPIEVSDEVPALIGQIPLGMLDLVIGTRARKLIPNPAHGGEQILELL